MKKEWLLPRAAVPVDMETITALVEHIKKLEGNIETLHAMYEQVSRQRNELMDIQRSMVEAMMGRIQ